MLDVESHPKDDSNTDNNTENNTDNNNHQEYVRARDKSMKNKYIKKIIIVILITIISAILLCISLQRYILYVGAKSIFSNNIQSFKQFSNVTEVFIESSDGVKIQCALISPYIKGDDVKPTIIISFLANGSNISISLKSRRYFSSISNLIVNYRGYGLSEGFPSEKAIQLDSQAILNWVKANFPTHSIVVEGHSLGGAIAIDLASRNPSIIDHLLVINSFLSLPKLLHLNFLSFILFDDWNSEERFINLLKQAKGPIIHLYSSKEDEVIPSYHMKTFKDLHLQYRGFECKFTSFSGMMMDHCNPSSIEWSTLKEIIF